MEKRNWIWFAVALAALAAFAAGVAVLRSGSKQSSSEYVAPPPLQLEDPQPVQGTEEPPDEPSAPGTLDMSALRERCQAILTLTAQDEAPAAYPVEEAELREGEAVLRFVRAWRQAEEGRSCYRSDGAAYQLSEDLELLGDGAADTLIRTGETFTGAAVPTFVIACGDSCLRVEEGAFAASDLSLATRWVEEPGTGFWYTIAGGRRRYLNSDGLGDEGRTRWTLSGGVLRSDDPGGSLELYCDSGVWSLAAEGDFYLADSEGRCLNMDENGVLPDTGRGTHWGFDADVGGLGGYFYTYLNGRRYTLCLTDGQLGLSTEPFSDYWVYQDGVVSLFKDGVNYCLHWRAGSWRAEPMLGWRISDGERYLSVSGSGVAEQTEADSAAVWRIEDAGEGVVICTGENETSYLGAEETHLLLSADLRTLWYREGNTLRTEGGALCFRDGWQLGEADTLRFEQVFLPMPALRELKAEDTQEVTLLPAEELEAVERGEPAVLSGGPVCCVPLCCGDSYAASADNPGYLCPGQSPMRLRSMDQATFRGDLTDDTLRALTRAAGDDALRPARADEGEFGRHCRRFLQSVGDGGPWGLQLSGVPRADDLAVLPLARFGGQRLRDCELVRNSVDLRLTEEGTLSVFAAGGPEGLFTLYSVVRDPDTGRVTGLREISRVLRGQEQYVYDYTEGGLPVRAEAETVFDTAWMRDGVEAGALYYYEIPLNAGEYALASVPGGESVLLYLSVSEQALGDAPAEDPAARWAALSDRALLTFLDDSANAAALGKLLRSEDAGPLIDRVGQIADGAQRQRAAVLLEELGAEPAQPDWRACPDAVFIRWLLDPDNRRELRELLEEEPEALFTRVGDLASHEDYFLAWERLNQLLQAG